jgi:hypothetical protein
MLIEMKSLFENLEFYQAVILIATAFFAIVLKIRQSFSLRNRKQNLKQDIEILDLLKRQNSFDSVNIESRIKKELDFIYDTEVRRELGLTGFLLGFVFFVGFGLSTIHIYNSSDNFNAGMILTLFFAASGVYMMLTDSSAKSKTIPFYKIGLFNKSNMVFGLMFTLFSSLIAIALFYKTKGFKIWYIVVGIVFLYGMATIFRNIKRIN